MVHTLEGLTDPILGRISVDMLGIVMIGIGDDHREKLTKLDKCSMRGGGHMCIKVLRV